MTPGIYTLDKPITVEEKDTIIYGMGLATLVSTNGNACMVTSDVDGIKVCGVYLKQGISSQKHCLKLEMKKQKFPIAGSTYLL